MSEAGIIILSFLAFCFGATLFLDGLSIAHHKDNWALFAAYSLFVTPFMAIICALIGSWIMMTIFLCAAAGAIHFLFKRGALKF